MDNNNIEILDDFDLDEKKESTSNNTDSLKVSEIKKTEEIENPIVEMVNNKKTLKLIFIMLAVLFVAVFFMPTVFELFNN